MQQKRPLTSRLSALASAAVLLLAALPATAVAQAADAVHAPARITAPIDDKATVSLKGTVHPLATAARDRGVVDDGQPVERIQLLLKRTDAQEAALRQRITDMHTPGSAHYHQWLTPAQFGRQYGPAEADVAKLTAWLTTHGFTGVKLNPGGQTLEFSGTAGQFRRTFGAELHKFELNGRTHTANATEPRLPQAITPVVRGFASLNNFPLRSHAKILGKAAYTPATHRAKPSWTVGDPTNGYNFLLAPGDFAVQYDLNSLYSAGTDGTGQTIGIINESNVSPAIVAQYRSLFGLPANPLNVIIDGNDPGIDGINNPDGPNGASGEAYLDVELSGSVAPAATIDLIIAADTALANGLGIAAEHAVYGNTAPVLSLSFGQCEAVDGPDGNAFWNTLWEQAAAQGQTVMVSTGDNGSAACDDDNTQQYAVNGQAVSGLASTPWNVAVGGTDFFYSSYNGTSAQQLTQLEQYWGDPSTNASNNTPKTTLQQRAPEQPWNDSQYGLNLFNLYENGDGTSIAAGSGGASSCATLDSSNHCVGYPKPSWQVAAGVPADGVRDIPDVSLFAANGLNYTYYPICAGDGDCQPVGTGGTVQVTGTGGTSASTPAFAGMMALINQKFGPQGQADFVLYPLSKQHGSAFNDVTNGTNAVPCNIDTVSDGSQNFPANDCIAVSNPATGDDPTYGQTTEGEIGNTSTNTPEYNATTGYDLATGLGTIDAANLVKYWGDVTFAASSVTLTPAQTSVVHGTAVAISGSVTPSTSGGAVALETTSTEPLQAGQTTFDVTNGVYSGTVNFLPGGTYTIYGKYSGDGTNAPSSSAPVSITVTPESSVTALNVYNLLLSSAVGSGFSTPYGTQLLLDVSPTPNTIPSSGTYSTPTGTVTFTDNGSNINSATVNAIGEAEYNTAFPVGNHSVVANYSGDSSYSASSSAATTFTITQDVPLLLLTSSSAQSGNSTSVTSGSTLTVGVENSANLQLNSSGGVFVPAAAPTGVVTISGLPGGTLTFPALAATRDPNNQAMEGVAVVTLGAEQAGTYNVTVTYPGDTNYAATTASGSVVITAPSGIATTTTVTASQTSTNVDSAVQVTATVTGTSAGGAPTGTLTFFSSGAELGYLTIPSGGTGDSYSTTVSLNSESLVLGSNVITVQYSGNSAYAPSAGTVTINNVPGTVPTPNPGITVSSAAITITSPGGSGTSTITITPVNGFTGQVSLSCSVTGATTTDAPTCSVSTPGAITGTGAVTATLTVNTTAATSAALARPRFGFAPFGGVAVAGLLFFLAPVRRRRRASLFVVMLMLAGAGFIAGCGGGSSSNSGSGGGGTTGGTPAGNYSVTVTATANGVSSATTSVSVVVQ